MESKPSRRSFNFRMLVRGKDGEAAGNEDVYCVGYIDQWMRKEAEHQKQRKGAKLKTAIPPVIAMHFIYWVLRTQSFMLYM